jgi:hypothetical protein
MRTAVLLLLFAAPLAGQPGSIDGTVVDKTNSKPLSGVHVRLYIGAMAQMAKEAYGAITRWDRGDGKVAVQTGGLDGFTAYQISDPQGEYRMPRLAPGRYRVRAAPEAVHVPPEIRSDGTTELRSASTYYPDALTPQAATPLDIPAGAERTGIDIRLVRAPIVAVRGTVSGMDAGAYTGLSVRKVEPPRGPDTGRGEMQFADQVNPMVRSWSGDSIRGLTCSWARAMGPAGTRRRWK